MAGFTNALLLVCIALSVFRESVERFWFTPEVSSLHLFMPTAVGGLMVNLVGLWGFHDHAGHGHVDIFKVPSLFRFFPPVLLATVLKLIVYSPSCMHHVHALQTHVCVWPGDIPIHI
jgi:Co/Zn/Cd efflux system component